TCRKTRWWFDLQKKYCLRLTKTAPSMAFHLCRKCLAGVGNCFASSVGSTKPASTVILCDTFLQMTWWSWKVCAATGAVTTEASAGAEASLAALSQRGQVLELSLSTPTSTNCELILR